MYLLSDSQFGQCVFRELGFYIHFTIIHQADHHTTGSDFYPRSIVGKIDDNSFERSFDTQFSKVI